MTGGGGVLVVVGRDQADLCEYFRWGFAGTAELLARGFVIACLNPHAGARDWGTLR